MEMGGTLGRFLSSEIIPMRDHTQELAKRILKMKSSQINHHILKNNSKPCTSYENHSLVLVNVLKNLS